LKNPSPALLTAYKQASAIKASTQVIAEWNMNRFVSANVQDNGRYVFDQEWEDNWPKKSVVDSNRPGRGIVRARISNLVGAFGEDRANTAGLKVADKFVDAKPKTRYYLVSPDDTYRYWSSKQVTIGSVNAQGVYFFADEQALQVVYDKPVRVNKVVIGLESSEAAPKNYYVQVTYNGTQWVTIANNPVMDNDGRVTVWYSDAWIAGLNPPFNFSNANEIMIRGIRFATAGMSKQGAPLSVIEISGRFQQDLSQYLVNESHDMEVADSSDISPIGVSSSNKASVTLDNTSGLFYNEGTSRYAGLLDKNVRMWCNYILNGESFRQWTMYTENWTNQMSAEVSVDLYDSANFLQQIKTAAAFWEGMTAGSIIWRLMDSAGFANWSYTSSTDDVVAVPFYWNDKDSTVWDNIQKIAEATQTAAYFDEYDNLQIKNAKTLFSKTPAATWTFLSEKYAGSLPDIQEMEKSSDLDGANQVDIKYTETKFTDFNNGLPKMEVVWEPDDTMVLRAAPLAAEITIDQNYFSISQDEAATWPLSGMVNIEGEIISYEGKMYRYYNFYDNGNASYTTTLIKSEDERKKLDELTPEGIRWRNGYTGYFNIKERGVLGTSKKTHNLNSKFRYTYEQVQGGTQAVTHWDGGIIRNPGNSTVTLRGRAGFDWNTLYTLRSTESAYATNYRYGTRMRIPSGQPANKGAGGLYIKGGSNNSGFYINLAATEVVESTDRATRNELRFQIRTPDGNQPMKNYIPAPFQVNRDTWYDLEASTELHADGTMGVRVYIDGQLWYNTNISANEISDPFGRFGVFIQDQCSVEFDYLYAVGTESFGDPDGSSFYDLVKGGYVSNYFEKVVPYQNVAPGVVSRGTRTVNPSVSGTGQTWLDEFGPVVHEIRQFDIDFEKSPVAHSFLYLSNTDQVTCPVYVADSFGASFLLANTYRRNAVVNGDDTLTFGVDNSIDQKIFVYGRAFSDEDQQTETVKDDVSIKKRGLSVITFDSPFIQSKESAKRLGDWIITHWGNGTEEYQIKVFGNPFVSVGDIVNVYYPNKQMYADDKFCVVSLSSSSKEGIETSLTIRRL
jgi:hypothetical protein